MVELVKRSPNELLIYGVDHSPWVQAVTMACHIKGVPFRLVSGPLSWANYAKLGYVMPQCRWPDGTISADSFKILKTLDERYPSSVSADGLDEDEQTALERLFLSYILTRTGGLKMVRFVAGWSKMPSGRGAGWLSITRAIMALYFLVLITGGRFIARRRNFDPNHLSLYDKCLGDWSDRLTKSLYLGGACPNLLDVALFGHVQCMATGLTDACIDRLHSHPALWAWIERMQALIDGYSHDFSIRLQDRTQMPRRASGLDQTLFWLTTVGLMAAAPITVCLIMDAYRRRRRNPYRTGTRRWTRT